MFDKERKFANYCLNYHNIHIKRDNSLIDRPELYKYVKSFYSTRIGITLNKKDESTLKETLLNKDTILLEVAHDGQIPHLGVVRMVLKTYHISTLLPNSHVIYLIGDHYTAEMTPESTIFGMPLRGTNPRDVKQPISFQVGKKYKHIPLKWVAPPSSEVIDDVKTKVEAYLCHNIDYEKKKGNKVYNKEIILANIAEVIDILRESTSGVTNYADWMIKAQYLLFSKLMGDEISKITFLPMKDCYKMLGNEYLKISYKTKVINSIKREVSKTQVSRGLIPYQKSEFNNNTACFWIYCPKCKRRGRAIRSKDRMLKFRCNVCGTVVENSLDHLWDIAMPDIVCFETALFRLGISGWVVGSNAPYQKVIEQTYKVLYNMPMPPRFLLNSVPTFRGIGDPEEGYGRTTLLRALIEISEKKLFDALMKPWDEDPYIKSEFLVFERLSNNPKMPEKERQVRLQTQKEATFSRSKSIVGQPLEVA